MEQYRKEKFIADMKQGKLAVFASADAPISKNCIWLKDGVFYGYTNDGWENITEDYYDKLKKVPFTITNLSDEDITFYISLTGNESENFELDMEYSTDGENWISYNEDDITLTSKGYVQFRGNHSALGEFDEDEEDGVNYIKFTSDQEIPAKSLAISGNIMSLIKKQDYSELDTVSAGCFAYFLCDYDDEWSIFTEGLVDASDLVLPATTLSNGCYCGFFYKCNNLELAPELPAKTLSDNCYIYMFSACHSLLKTPSLPATTLAYNCYSNMFYGCATLTVAPILPVTNLANYCYYYMFANCSSLKKAPDLSSTILAEGCYDSMFKGCTALTEAPELPATELAESCYSGMFKGCTSLTTAPNLPAMVLKDACYAGMFSGCIALNKAPKLPATTLAGVCYSEMFSNCTSLLQAPELPATTLANSCYRLMFNQCSNLISASNLPATVGEQDCYKSMFTDCISLAVAPELSLISVNYGSCSGMFSGCTSLVNAPILYPQIVTSGMAYMNMFKNCTALKFVECRATTINNDSLKFWLQNVSNTGTFKCVSGVNYPSGDSGIPSGWTRVNI